MNFPQAITIFTDSIYRENIPFPIGIITIKLKNRSIPRSMKWVMKMMIVLKVIFSYLIIGYIQGKNKPLSIRSEPEFFLSRRLKRWWNSQSNFLSKTGWWFDITIRERPDRYVCRWWWIARFWICKKINKEIVLDLNNQYQRVNWFMTLI